MVLAFAIATTATAQSTDPTAPGVVSGAAPITIGLSEGMWGNYLPRVSFQHRTEGAGYAYSYSDVRAWVPIYESEDSQSLTFVDTAVLLANDSKVGMNAVIGQRFYFEELDRTFGGYVGYDNRDTGYQTVSQVATGFESLGRIDFRANAYLPTDSESQQIGATSFFNPSYVGNNIQLSETFFAETAMRGFDAEFGGAVPKFGDYLRAYVGTYNYQAGSQPQAWGFKTRFESHVSDQMRLYLTVTNDQVFDTNVVFGISLFWPGTRARRSPRYDDMLTRMDEPLIRKEAVTVNRFEKIQSVFATNTITNMAQRVVHVDPNATSNGDGSVENPYNSLAFVQGGSQANDFVFVHPNSNGSSTNLDSGIALQDRQRLLASTTQHKFTATQGTFDLPGYESGNKPVLDSTGVTVQLANGNEVSGFKFDDPGNTAINGGTVNGFDINNNAFEHLGSLSTRSIYVTDLRGEGVIRNNDVTASAANSSGDAISVASSGTAKITIADNAISRNLSIGGDDAIQVAALSGADLEVNITNNRINNFMSAGGYGINLTSAGNDLSGTVSNNRIFNGLTTSATDYAISSAITNGTSDLTISNNTIGTVASAQLLDAGIRLYYNGASDTLATITYNSIDNFGVAGAFNEGIAVEISNGGTHDFVITNNSIKDSFTNVASNGLSLSSTGTGSVVNANIQDNTIDTSFSGSGIAVTNSFNSTINLRMRNNLVADDVVFNSAFSTALNFEVFNGQMVPATLISADITGQNTITGSAGIFNSFGSVSTRVAPNSLPIPE
ncbi:hypothetical protein [Bremerella cremea]|nr:hypothetical protein [Bremerella cremea]